MPDRFRMSFVALALVGAACAGSTDAQPPAETSSGSTTVSEGTVPAPTTTLTAPVPASTTTSLPPDDGRLRNQFGFVFPDAPPVTTEGALADPVAQDLETLWASLTTEDIAIDAIERLGQSGDVRLGWLMADLLRFIQTGPVQEALLTAASELVGIDLSIDPVAARNPWQSLTDHLISWDLPAQPSYREFKGRLFTIIEPGWAPFFEDADATVNWRLTSWGGVRIDDRVLGDQNRCPRGCIPALDDPSVTPADQGGWYPDERIVFGVVINDEARAYPKHQMEIHEMVNDTLGGRRIGVPYCTLCGSAQVYFTDSVPNDVEVPVLRTSGLLTRSNKVMYDLNSFSIFDTFTGEAKSGPLREAEIVLEQGSVITTTWGEWKAAHPETTILAEDGGIGRSYGLDPLGGRDDDGPIFPIGNVDPRLPVQAEVIGVIALDGTPLAFPVEDLRSAFESGKEVELGGVMIFGDGGGFVAQFEDGAPTASHQAFWFAWSQFHPETLLWSLDALGS